MSLNNVIKNIKCPLQVVIEATIRSNQSERSTFCLDQSESSISPMWPKWRQIAHEKPRDPIGIKNTRTQELNPHSWHSFNDRVKPGDKRDVCDALVTSRPLQI